MKTIGERIYKVRRGYNETQQDFAKKFRVSRAAVAQWESNKTRPSHKIIETMVKLYKLKYEWLLDGIGPAPTFPKKLLLRRLPHESNMKHKSSYPELGLDTLSSIIKRIDQNVTELLELLR